jgi:DNA repair exonuclease SbcCD ATPase subunit
LDHFKGLTFFTPMSFVSSRKSRIPGQFAVKSDPLKTKDPLFAGINEQQIQNLKNEIKELQSQLEQKIKERKELEEAQRSLNNERTTLKDQIGELNAKSSVWERKKKQLSKCWRRWWLLFICF